MNLIMDAWIPVLHRSGKTSRIAPWEVTGFPEDPPLALRFVRPDYNGSMMQFLIGLFQTLFMPDDDDAWQRLLEEPPDIEKVKNRFSEMTHAFRLDGDVPRFMQAYETFGPCNHEPIGSILIESPGAQTLAQNRDLFVKRDLVPKMCLHCAAAALFTLQCNAPSGGRGHLTSIRGGGPLTTLLLGETLWESIWFNILARNTLLDATGNWDLSTEVDIFPWLAPTRSREVNAKFEATTPLDVNPLQMYWNLPRRIHLTLESESCDSCAVCGGQVKGVCTGFDTRPNGVNYSGAWSHPLTPYYRSASGETLPVHPHPGGIGYCHWVGLVVSSEDASRIPARVIRHHLENRADSLALPNKLRVWAFGFDMDNAKARCWYESTMPLIHVPRAQSERYVAWAQKMVGMADLAARSLLNRTRTAWNVKSGGPLDSLGSVTSQFWADTEPDFFAGLELLARDIEQKDACEISLRSWHAILVRAALRVFDEVVLSEPIEHGDPARVSRARIWLWRDLHNKSMNKYLGIATDEGGLA